MASPRANVGHLVAAVGGVLLFGFLFVPWFGVASRSSSAWETFSLVDIVLCVIAVAVAATGLVCVFGSSGRFRLIAPRVITWCGVIALVLTVAFMIEYTSGDFGSLGVGLKVGSILSLLACLVILVGGILAGRPELLASLRSIEIAPAPPGGRSEAPTRQFVPPPPPATDQVGKEPGWYEDPRGAARLRYWDGRGWTDETSA